MFGLIAAAVLSAAQGGFKEAGVCARCHVAPVVEWSVSAHFKAGTGCASCHGASAGHVLNERNQVKPDRVAAGATIAGLCRSCHAPGCRKTGSTADCQSCHHPHALLNPAPGKPAVKIDDAGPDEHRRRMQAGQDLVRAGNFAAARTEFAAALRAAPGDRRARALLRACERRLNPGLPGCTVLGTGFDADTGLPLRVRVEGLATEMVLIPGGEFGIGSDRYPASRPRHDVRLEPFYLAVRELSQREWAALGLPDPSVHRGDDLPVNNVSWEDCRDWIARLNARVPGGGFRLPTEVEWEAAAAGVAVEPATAAWFRDNTAAAAAARRDYLELDAYAPRPVGGKQASPRGLFDMAGNVWEWCASLFRPYPYDARDGRESLSGGGLRVLRGGGYADSAAFLDAALRHHERPARRQPWNGVRVARSVPE